MNARTNSPQRPLRTLLFSTLYPSSVRATHGIFVETRLRELLKSGQIETKVIAPVPWFPSTHTRFGIWAEMARTPHHEQHHGIEVWHPRYLLPPKVGMTIAPLTLALGARRAVARLRDSGWDFDLIDAHYYYPDGVAAALLARWFNKPLTITARGTDLTLIPQHILPRRWIQWAEQQATGSIGVCADLMDNLRALGGAPEKMHVMRNGVDLVRFQPQSPQQARSTLKLTGETILLSVGHLIERKGHHFAIDALVDLPQATLYIVGAGAAHAFLQQRAQQRGVTDRVHLVGAVDNQQLAHWYSAADVLILASSREGWANVLLESMACGTPVVATAINGTPEVVQSEVAGRLIEQRNGAAIATAVKELLANPPDRAQVRRYAEGFSWDDTSTAQLNLFNKIAQRTA